MTHKLTVKEGDLVRVYKNINKGTWSVTIKVEGKWKVACQCDWVTLRCADPITTAAGAARIRKTGHREVTAKVEGIFVHSRAWERQGVLMERVHYDPWVDEHFHHCDGTVFEGSGWAVFEPFTTKTPKTEWFLSY